MKNDPIKFIEQYWGFKVTPFQKRLMKKIMNGERVVIRRPRPYDKSIFYRELKKAFESGKIVIHRNPLIIIDEANTVPAEWIEAKRKEWVDDEYFDKHYNGDWPAEAFGVDVAMGEDKSVTMKVPKEKQ